MSADEPAYSFNPGRLRSGHAMTLFTWAWPRRFPHLPDAEPRLFATEPGVQVLAHCHWQPNRRAHPTLLVLHGLEGSSEAHYVRGIAQKALAAGLNVVRLNQRNCGRTEHLCDTLYHSGLTSDPAAVLRELVSADGLNALAVAGYSLGGNLALKLAGDFGEAPPPELQAVAAVSPVMDLDRCVRALERPSNAVYQWNFVRNLKARLRRKARLFPDRFPVAPLARVRTVRDFDDVYTAPHFGFAGASDYYHRASALRVVERIRVPTLILTAADDPFVPPEPFHDPAVTGNPHITVRVSAHGGHCAFLGPRENGSDGYWAEEAVVRFAAARCAVSREPRTVNR
jgi:predicted alpha/beta-fold hydrolase